MDDSGRDDVAVVGMTSSTEIFTKVVTPSKRFAVSLLHLPPKIFVKHHPKIFSPYLHTTTSTHPSLTTQSQCSLGGNVLYCQNNLGAKIVVKTFENIWQYLRSRRGPGEGPPDLRDVGHVQHVQVRVHGDRGGEGQQVLEKNI